MEIAQIIPSGYHKKVDSITHTLTGGVIAKAIDDLRIGRWGSVAGWVAGVFPDIDFVLGLFNHQFYLQYHRDFTHSFIFIPFYAGGLSWLFTKISKRSYFWSFYLISLLGLLSHVLLDLLTSYGTMILSPFSENRFSWDLVFIIDLIFSGILILPWMVSLLIRKRALWICRGILFSLTIYIMFCWFQHQKALTLAQDFSRKLNEETLQVAALPQPLSPFRWALYIETHHHIYQGFVDLRRQERVSSETPSNSYLRRLNHLYDPPQNVLFHSAEKLPNSPWVKRALNTEGVRFFYWFARFPIVKAIQSDRDWHRVEFMDMRFYIPGFRQPFIYQVEFDGSGRILNEGFLGNQKKR